MFCRQRVWGVLPFRAFLIYPTLSLDLAKLLPLVGPNTRIAWPLIPWTIRFDQSVGCLNGTMTPSFLSHQTYIVAAALPNYLIVVKLCCLCVVVACLLYCCGYVVVGFFFLYLFSATLVVGPWIMMYVIIAALVKGFWVLLYNHFAFLLTRLSGRYPFFYFQSSYVLFIKKRKKVGYIYIYIYIYIYTRVIT